MPILEHIWIVPLLPLLGAAINGIFGKKWANSTVNAVGLGSTGLSFLFAVEAVREFFGFFAQHHEAFRKEFFDWIVVNGVFQGHDFRIGFDLQVDQLTVVMLMVVTGVGFLIHIYSTGYMAHEGGYYRFFSYLNLFMFFMLILVLAANFVLMMVGWEGVGLCSYLLIGFYFLKKSASDAGKKAFIVNRVGDFGFVLGMFLIYRTFHSLDFQTVFDLAQKNFAPEAFGQFGTLTVACILLFVGATAKSAQIPLYVWLPDAMEGPTPVSALIHAATMVTAGVYMIARSNVLYAHAPTALFIVAVIGCATAFFAASIAPAQTDIKRVLAYSTVSQIGYMMLGCGVGAFAAGVFHLMTHAFFKALLFLASGSVIHAMSGEQDMWNMGGLKSKIKVTFWTMLIGTIAIAGIPPFAAFFSKDAVLFAAYNSENGGKALYVVGLLAAILTAFYMFRLIYLTFYGEHRFDEHKIHVHESPKSMLWPLIILAVLSTFGGWFALPELFGGHNYFFESLEPVFEHSGGGAGTEGPHNLSLILSGVAALSAVFGWLVARGVFGKGGKKNPNPPAWQTVLYNKYYVDELYNFLIVAPLVWVSRNLLWKLVDVGIIDGAVNGVAHGTTAIGDVTRRTQSGNARSYAVWVVVGALLLFAVIFWPVLRPVLGMVR